MNKYLKGKNPINAIYICIANKGMFCLRLLMLKSETFFVYLKFQKVIKYKKYFNYNSQHTFNIFVVDDISSFVILKLINREFANSIFILFCND